MVKNFKNTNRDVTMIVPVKADDFKYIEKLIPFVKQNINPKDIFIISSKEVENTCIKLKAKFLDENKLIENLNFNKLEQKLCDLNIDTSVTGWFFQQFLKLGFYKICKTKYYVCWDADMLPIRKINLFDDDGKPFFTLKKEYQRRYFITLKRLLNINKVRKESFIAEHMIFDIDLVAKMINQIENSQLKGETFWEKILYATLPEVYNDIHAFSEFETYGNWVEKNYPTTYAKRKLNMCRHAKYFLGKSPTNNVLVWAAKDFDTLSFEHFDKQLIPSIWLKTAKKIMSFSHFLRITSFFLKPSIKHKLSEFDWFWGKNAGYENISTKEKDINDACKLKILFDASIINSYDEKGNDRSGIYWVSFNVLKYLALRSDVKLYLYSSNMQKTKGFIKYYATEIQNLNLFSGDIRQMDIYLSSLNQIPNTIKITNIPCFTIIHDCIPLVLPEHFEVCKGWFPDLLNSFTSDDYFFSNSEYTKKDFLKFCPRLDADKITTIPLSTNLPYKPNKNLTAKIRKKYNIPADKKYLFSLCSLEPRKNLIRAVRTFIQFINKNKINNLVFVLGGGAYEGFIERFEKEVPDYQKYKDKIIRAGYVDDEDMEVLYSNAEWFVYTSRYEGFGMPPLEAMACGTAVITSNNSSLPEVVGDAGQMIDWDSDEQHVAAYEKYYFDKKYRDEMAQKGLERSKLFSWKKAVDIMVDAFKKCEQPAYRTSYIISYDEKQETLPKYVTFKLFSIFSLLKIKIFGDKKKFLLFGFLPIFGIKSKGKYQICKILGLPLFKLKHFPNNVTTKYYALGVPVLKISRK